MSTLCKIDKGMGIITICIGSHIVSEVFVNFTKKKKRINTNVSNGCEQSFIVNRA